MISPTLYISKTSICVRGEEDFSLKKNSFEKSHRFLIFIKRLLTPAPRPTPLLQKNSYPKKQVYASKKGTTMLKCFIICLDHKHYFKKNGKFLFFQERQLWCKVRKVPSDNDNNSNDIQFKNKSTKVDEYILDNVLCAFRWPTCVTDALRRKRHSSKNDINTTK